MYIFYRALNTVTRAYHFPIGRFSDNLDRLGDSYGQLWFIRLGARSGYHQVSIWTQDQEKLKFFGPDDNKYC